MEDKVSTAVICQGLAVEHQRESETHGRILDRMNRPFCEVGKDAMGKEWHRRCTFCRNIAWIVGLERAIMCARLGLDVDSARIYFAGTSKPTSRMTTGMLKRDVETASMSQSWPPTSRSCCCRVGGMSEQKGEGWIVPRAAALAKRVVGLGPKTGSVPVSEASEGAASEEPNIRGDN